MPNSKMQLTDALVQFATVAFDRDTYKRLLYLLVACPLALVYFVGTTTGLSLDIGLSVTLIGVPILLVTLLAVTSAASIEAYFARVCLNCDASTPVALPGVQRDLSDPEVGSIETLERFLTEPSTWTSLGVVAVKSVFGLIAFVALVVLTSIVASLLAAPLLYDHTADAYQIGTYTVDTLSGAVGVSGMGILLGLVALHLLNAVADLGGYLTKSLLSVARPHQE